MALIKTIVGCLLESRRVVITSALLSVLLAALPLAGQIGSAHARLASADQAKPTKAKASQRQTAKKATNRKRTKAHRKKLSKANKASAKRHKAVATKHHAKKKQLAKKRKATRQKSVKRQATRRETAKRQASKRKRSASKQASRKASKRKTTRRAKAQRYVAARPTLGTVFRLQQAHDPLSLRSSVAYVFEPGSQRELFSKNSGVVLPIASITKLMTAIVVIDAGQPMREMLTVTRADIDRLRGSSSRLAIGTRLSRGEMLQLALMSSANRAANALGRHYPGGLPAFVSAMNAKARMFGMTDTQFADPTGLSGANVSNAKDIARLAGMAHEYPLIREYSTAGGLRVDTGYKRLNFHNTNRLIASDSWSIGLQKTGYIAEAGRCLVMVARIDGRNLVMVLLDSHGNTSRFADAQRIRQWLLKGGPGIYAAGETTALN